MKTYRVLVASVAVLLLAACATTPTRPVKSDFLDIPVPQGMAYVPDRSTVIESPAVRMARFVYRGRLEMGSLGTSMQGGLERSGWRRVSVATTSTDATTQLYEKAGNYLQILLWEGSWYTYMEVTASRALQAMK